MQSKPKLMQQLPNYARGELNSFYQLLNLKPKELKLIQPIRHISFLGSVNHRGRLKPLSENV